jgi:Tfp pilus assembly protein PilN
VRAVNLIPADQRRGPRGASRSGGAVYVLLGVLAALVLGVAAYALTVNQVSSQKAELGRLQAQTAVAQAQADAFAPYRKFAALKQQRVATIEGLASSRFDWEVVMRKLASVVPANVWLTSLVGTVAPGVNVQSKSGGADSGNLRDAEQVPALEMVGCTTGHAEVSRFMSRLRVIDGVTRVSLASSEKQDTAAGASGAGGGGGSDGCRGASSAYPQFSIVVFFGGAAKAAPGAAAPAGGSAPAAAPGSGTSG